MKSFLIILYILFACVVWLYAHIFPCDNSVFSYIFLSIFILSIIVIWNIAKKQVSIYVLFFLTFGLFIGGRFIVNLWDNTLEPFTPSYFFDYSVSYERKLDLMDYIIGFMVFSTLGYYFAKKYPLKMLYNPSVSSLAASEINKKLQFIFPIVMGLVVFSCIIFVAEALKGGYLAHFVEAQSNDYEGSGLAKWLSVLLSVLLGLAVVYGKQKTVKLYIGIFLIQALANLFVGSRSSFGVFILFLLWLYSDTHKINLFKLFTFVVSGMLLLLWLFSFSIREMSSDRVDLSIGESIKAFLYTQGSSLMVFDASRLIDDYPILPYFQTFIPGISVIYGLFAGTSLTAYDISFSNYMCYSLNSDLFFNGAGLGWSFLADMNIFSGEIFAFYLLLSFLWGGGIGLLESWAQKNTFYKCILISLSIPILLIPRGTLSSFFPLIFYILFLWIIFYRKKKIA